MIAFGLLAATAVFAYRLGDPSNGLDRADASGLAVCSLLGMFFAGILLLPAAAGGLLLGYAQSSKAKHRPAARVIGALLLSGIAALGLGGILFG